MISNSEICSDFPTHTVGGVCVVVVVKERKEIQERKKSSRLGRESEPAQEGLCSVGLCCVYVDSTVRRWQHCRSASFPSFPRPSAL